MTGEVPDAGIEVEAFKKAATLGIHRTVHAGESGSAEMVKRVSGSDLLFPTVTVMYYSSSVPFTFPLQYNLPLI